MTASFLWSWTYGINRMLYPHPNDDTAINGLISTCLLLAVPLAILFVLMSDASIDRPKIWTILTLFAMIALILSDYVDGMLHNKIPGAPQLCLEDDNCVTMDRIVSRPAQLQLIIW